MRSARGCSKKKNRIGTVEGAYTLSPVDTHVNSNGAAITLPAEGTRGSPVFVSGTGALRGAFLAYDISARGGLVALWVEGMWALFDGTGALLEGPGGCTSTSACVGPSEVEYPVPGVEEERVALGVVKKGLTYKKVIRKEYASRYVLGEGYYLDVTETRSYEVA